MNTAARKMELARQRGIATLLFTIILLAVVSVLSLNGTKVAVLEQKLTNNNYRANQAFYAAQAGMRVAMSSASAQDLEDKKDAGGNVSYTLAKADLPALNPIERYQITYATTTAGDYTNILATTVGESVYDANVTHEIKQLMRFTPFVQNAPSPVGAVIARGTANISGSSSLQANDTDVAVWSGGNATAGGTNTVVDNGTDGIYDNHADLQNLTAADAFFTNFFSEKMAVVKNYAHVKCSASCGDSTVNGLSDKVIYIDGNLSISGNTTVGTAAKPVILIVIGTLSLNHTNAQINGVVYTTTSFNNGSGKGRIDGALIVDGDFSTTNGLNINHSTAIINTLNKQRGVYVPVAGSWVE